MQSDDAHIAPPPEAAMASLWATAFRLRRPAVYSLLIMPIRINKLLSQRGFCSRREADRLIEEGRVTIDGKTAVPGDKTEETSDVRVDGQPVAGGEVLTYIMLNKPVGVITTTDRRMKDNVLTLVDIPQRVFPVGRLDVSSEGLLLLTNDGELANRLTHPRYGHDKEYLVTTVRPIAKQEVRRLEEGVSLDDGPARAVRARARSADTVSMVLREGRNRQVRRMFAAIGHDVKRLRRTRIATLSLERLPPGEWRRLTPEEAKTLKNAVGL